MVTSSTQVFEVTWLTDGQTEASLNNISYPFLRFYDQISKRCLQSYQHCHTYNNQQQTFLQWVSIEIMEIFNLQN